MEYKKKLIAAKHQKHLFYLRLKPNCSAWAKQVTDLGKVHNAVRFAWGHDVCTTALEDRLICSLPTWATLEIHESQSNLGTMGTLKLSVVIGQVRQVYVVERLSDSPSFYLVSHNTYHTTRFFSFDSNRVISHEASTCLKVCRFV